MCDIVAYFITPRVNGVMQVNTPSVAQSMCRTHNWFFEPGSQFVDALCPIGRIEQATDIALAKIEAAKLGSVGSIRG